MWLTGGLLLTTLTFFFGTYPAGEGPRLWLGSRVSIYSLLNAETVAHHLPAAYLADRLPFSFNLVQLLLPGLVLVIAALVILLAQRDLEHLAVHPAVFFHDYLTSGKRRVLLVGGILILLAAQPPIFCLISSARGSIRGSIPGSIPPAGLTNHQSMIAIGAGGVFGMVPGWAIRVSFPSQCPISFFQPLLKKPVCWALSAGRFMVLLSARAWFDRCARSPVTTVPGHRAVDLYRPAKHLISGGNIRLLPLTASHCRSCLMVDHR